MAAPEKPVIAGKSNDNDKWWLALLALGSSDYSNADAYWRAHVGPMFSNLLSNGPGDDNNFTFDPIAQRYVRSNGRAVKEDEIRALLLAFLASAADDMEQDAGRMVRGEVSIDQWQANQAQRIKDLYIASYAAGRGGLSSINEEDSETITGSKSGNGIAGTLKRLRKFGDQIESEGDTAETSAQIVNRAGLYAGPAHTQFEAGRRAARKTVRDEDGQTIQWEERNILDDQAEHCKSEEHSEGCPEVTDMGWQPMGTLPLPGLRTCGPSCRCHMNYRPIEKPTPLTMSESQKPIVGLILSADAEFGPALTLGSDLPPKRNGFKCHYYTKEMLRPSVFTDANKQQWEITEKDIEQAVIDFNRALKLGHEPAIQDRHRKDPDRKGYGWVVGAKKNARGGMDWIHQFLGDDARDEALKRKSSVMLIPDYEDEKGNKFKWWPDHSAMVLNPRLRDLEDFKPALAASDGQAVNAVFLDLAVNTGDSPMATDLSVIRAALGDAAKDQPDDKVLALCADEIISTRTKLKDQAEANGVVVKKLKETELERDTAKQLALDDAETEVDPRVIAGFAKAARSDVTLALTNGEITKKQADQLLERLKQKPALALSADDTTASPIEDLLAFAKLGADDPKPNKPIVRGQPVKPLALAESEEEVKPVTPERKAELLAIAGYTV